MKIAVCISGQVRNSNQEAVNKLKTVFPTADFYYHTWKGLNVSKTLNSIDILRCHEPSIDYHTILDIDDCKNQKFNFYKDNPNKIHKKFLHASKQILAHAFLVCQLKQNYDIIIRTRWDVKVSKEVDFFPYLEIAYDQGPVGFHTRSKRGDDIHKPYIVDKNKLGPDGLPDPRWYSYLPDVLIMHKPIHFNTDYVYELHENKKLMAAEWGWYQTMSEPYNDHHTSVRGGCAGGGFTAQV